jgi:hypothetical protein
MGFIKRIWTIRLFRIWVKCFGYFDWMIESTVQRCSIGLKLDNFFDNRWFNFDNW